MFHCERQEILNELMWTDLRKLVLFVLLQTLSLELNTDSDGRWSSCLKSITAEMVSLFENISS